MCGITGFWQSSNFSGNEAKVIVSNMAERIRHRGPNDSGSWLDDTAGIALAHQRLSIVDLSPAGHQPMISNSGRYVIVFNGEIYNHLGLRSELECENHNSSSAVNATKKNNWRGHSDTETLLASFEAWGIECTLKKTIGMFAIALWDRKEKMLTLARDRVGEKPLYYGFQNKTFLFGSELKALKAHPDFLGEIDRDVICLYLRHCYIPAPYSIYKGIQKLLPGTYLQVRFDSEVTSKVYWSMADVVAKGSANPFEGSDADAIVALDNQLNQSVGLQMTADVPLGAFLSGGIDSSTVVAIMQSKSARPVKTFSIGFDEVGYNEAKYAKAIAKYLGTEHTELYVSSADAMGVIPLLGKIYDEPFADSSQIPTFLVAQMAKQHVTVSLSGDGGDELFCGYNSYAQSDYWKELSNIPFGIRKSVGYCMKTLSLLCRNEKIDNFSSRLINVNSISQLFYGFSSVISNPEKIVIGAKEPSTWLTGIGMNMSFKDAKLHMMFMDAMTYLPDDILVKVDRAAMANSLETRVPFLDQNVLEFAWRLPMNMKMRDGEKKWILRQLLNQYVPKDLIDRPKAGFGIPLADWLRGPLRCWVDDLLDEQRMRREGYFNASYVRELWRDHLSGKRNHQSLIWSILMFQNWIEKNK